MKTIKLLRLLSLLIPFLAGCAFAGSATDRTIQGMNDRYGDAWFGTAVGAATSHR